MKAQLSILLESAHGKAGTVVFKRAPTGTVIVPRIKPRNPQTPAQQAARANLGRAAAAFRALTSEQFAIWQEYARMEASRNAEDQEFAPAANSIFIGLASKFLQINPAADIPITPPAEPFTGDSVEVELETTETPEGVVATFVPDQANRPGAVTELLVQRLKSRNRTPELRAYRTHGFTTFPESTPITLHLPSGHYRFAVRFCCPTTGQLSGLTQI